MLCMVIGDGAESHSYYQVELTDGATKLQVLFCQFVQDYDRMIWFNFQLESQCHVANHVPKG